MPRIPNPPNLDDALCRYQAGVPEQKLALELGVDRGYFRRRLLAAGIVPRGISEANRLRMARMSTNERLALTEQAHAAMRGRKPEPEWRIKQALGIEASCKATPGESLLAWWLLQHGVITTSQKAVGPYNIDLAIEKDAIAVELFGGGWHNYGRHAARFEQRAKYLIDSGWTQLYIWIDGRRFPLTEQTAKHVVAFVQATRNNPSIRGRYWVIRANGEAHTVCYRKFDHWADIVSPISAFNTKGPN